MSYTPALPHCTHCLDAQQQKGKKKISKIPARHSIPFLLGGWDRAGGVAGVCADTAEQLSGSAYTSPELSPCKPNLTLLVLTLLRPLFSCLFLFRGICLQTQVTGSLFPNQFLCPIPKTNNCAHCSPLPTLWAAV